MNAAECGFLTTAARATGPAAQGRAQDRPAGRAGEEDVMAGRLRRLAARLAAAMPDGPVCEVATYGRCPPGRAATVLRAAGLLIGLALRQGPAWDGGAVVIVLESDPDGRIALRLAHGPGEPAAVEAAVVLDGVRRLAGTHGGSLRVHRGVVTTTELILPPPRASGNEDEVAARSMPLPGALSLDDRLARAERREVAVISLVFAALLAAMTLATLWRGADPGRGEGPARSVCVGGMLLAGTRCPGPG